MPYFFLSYAHTPRHDPEDPRDPDKWVVDFFNDLCTDIMHLTHLPHGARPGFMDRELRAGHVWPSRLAEALATCRVFVPLYSSRYFKSEQCGKEWFAFTRRALDHAARGGQRSEAIVPALWVPVGVPELPDVARFIQFDHRELGERYGTHGLYGIIKLSRYRGDYEEAVYELARRIVDVAQRAPIGSAEPADYPSLMSAFGDGTGPRDRRLRVTVVAPDVSDLPEGRSPYYYGQAAHEWNPYRPDCVVPLADHAASLVRELGYQPDIGDFDEHRDDLLTGGEPPSEPGLLLVDAWSTVSPDWQARLNRFDGLHKPWISVVVPWNRQDSQTVGAEQQLRHGLDLSLHRKLAEGRLASRTAVNGIPSLEQFSVALPVVVQAAAGHYLKYAKAYPPEGPVIERPRLRGPEQFTDPAGREDSK